jgi:transcriptional regulator with XRE-family HTH domain
MLKHEELIKTPEYLLEIIQNELYRRVDNYMKTENINQTQLAQKLGVSKGYISQILNGGFNHTLKKLIDLSISIGLVPKVDFVPINEVSTKTVKTKPNVIIARLEVPFSWARVSPILGHKDPVNKKRRQANTGFLCFSNQEKFSENIISGKRGFVSFKN